MSLCLAEEEEEATAIVVHVGEYTGITSKLSSHSFSLVQQKVNASIAII